MTRMTRGGQKQEKKNNEKERHPNPLILLGIGTQRVKEGKSG